MASAVAEEHKVAPQDECPIVKVVRFLRSKVKRTPDVGIVCGSGLSGLAESLQNPVTILYKDIPGFPHSSVAGHTNELVFGEVADKLVVCMRGRFHCYEGWTMQESTIGIRVMAALGCRVLIATNAAGGVNKGYKVGDVMVFKTHISLPGLGGQNPLVGENDDRFGPRFPAQAYDEELAQLALDCAKKVGLPSAAHVGTYCHVSGPSYETMGEIGFLRAINGDAVGMSTIPEMIVGFHSGMRVLGLSLITNECMGPGDSIDNRPTHEEVLAAVKDTQDGVRDMVKVLLETLNLSQTLPTRAGQFFANIQ